MLGSCWWFFWAPVRRNLFVAVVLNDTEWPPQPTSTVDPQNSNLTQQFVCIVCPFKGQLLKTPNFVQKFWRYAASRNRQANLRWKVRCRLLILLRIWKQFQDSGSNWNSLNSCLQRQETAIFLAHSMDWRPIKLTECSANLVITDF